MSQQGAKPQQKTAAKGKAQGQRGGFVLGLIVGLLLGLAVALGVALYITKVPVPFINKVPQRTAENDAEEAARNKNWDPNAPLAGKAGAKISSGVVGGAAPAGSVAASAPTAMATPSPTPTTAAASTPSSANPAPAATTKPAEKTAEKATEKAADKAEKPTDKKTDAKTAAAAAADPFIYFVQAGAFVKAEDAEQQRAKLAMLGFTAKVMEREQSGRTVLRVRIGPMDGRDEAEDLQKKVEAAGIEANLVRVQR
ncbi:SPOR domain-containing protein [Paucibacter sp. Y2R2-4]|uniref:SPOR domain-containing protein n=1 Tax=Paucibacter sp. Y2R2-4 TaxID=2893553 RepID=UPI0021E4448F|nr:SPOR domain-containing protein [Paucibacter sp. Y2R2-4]MCV2351377.1 SPOR domain-containing protein [Paucibacter sp. Y2R2-4]